MYCTKFWCVVQFCRLFFFFLPRSFGVQSSAHHFANGCTNHHFSMNNFLNFLDFQMCLKRLKNTIKIDVKNRPGRTGQTG